MGKGRPRSKNKKRGRCVLKNNQTLNSNEPEELKYAPHSFVIHRGAVGKNIITLMKDFRKVMEPFTASALRARKANSMKDFLAIAGMLHVSHMCTFTSADTGTFLKLARIPQGPTLYFKILNFSLSKDVISSLKKQLVFDLIFKNSPLVILNNFGGDDVQLKLMTSMFQNMFPAINLTKVNLNTIRRCVLFNYTPETQEIDFRHFAIKVAPVGLSKGVKKIVTSKVPNLSKLDDIADFITKGEILSESEAEDDPSNHIVLPQKISTRGNMTSSKSAIRLSELGPRMTLKLIKIEEGFMTGEVLYHTFISKTEEEKQQLRETLKQRKKEKELRQKVQERNKIKKEKAKEELKKKAKNGVAKKKKTEKVADSE